MAHKQLWPSTWYKDGKIPCPATNCGEVFSENVSKRELSNHWMENLFPSKQVPATIMDSEHSILYHLLYQDSCPRPHCSKTFANINDLFLHETSEHTNLDTFSIEGFIRAVRLGWNSEQGHKAIEPIFRRLMHKLRSDPVAIPLYQHAKVDFPNKLTEEELIDVRIPSYLHEMHGAPYYKPIFPDDFLQHLNPKFGVSDTKWEQSWNRLRQAYAEGSI